MAGMLLLALVLVLVGCTAAGTYPAMVVHKYQYQAVPPATPGGTPASPPAAPVPVPYTTLYPARTDDPTLVVFENASNRSTVRLIIDGGQEIVLQPGRITANIHLDVGRHEVRVRREVPTALGARHIPEQLIPIWIDARGRWQHIVLSD